MEMGFHLFDKGKNWAGNHKGRKAYAAELFDKIRFFHVWSVL
jgi:hypothetical protein